MAGINLLPWRDAARERSQKMFVTSVIGAVVLGAVSSGVGYVHMDGRISYQEERNSYIEGETNKLEKAIAEIKSLDANRKALLDRISIIERLQLTRPGIVHMLDEMVNALPDGLYLTKLKQEGNKIRLEGKAESSARVSSYMNRLNGSPWLSSSNLNTIKVDANNNKSRLRYFSLTVSQLLKNNSKKSGEQ